MRIVKIVFTALIAGLLCVSCGGTAVSRVPFAGAGADARLAALNGGASDGHIDSRGGYAYFAFPEGFAAEPGKALEIAVGAEQGEEYALAFGFLFDEDFSGKGHLNKTLAERPLVRTDDPASGIAVSYLTGNVSVSLSLPPAGTATPRGFLVYMRYRDDSKKLAPLFVSSAALVPARLGWDFSGGEPWFGFEYTGGVIPSVLNAITFSPDSSLFSGGDVPYNVTFKLIDSDSGANPSEQERVYFTSGKDTGYIRLAHGEKEAVFCSLLFSEPLPQRIAVTQGSSYVTGMIAEPMPLNLRQTQSVPLPLPADPGLILDWPRDKWRQSDYELFSWSRFPSLLIFDTGNYRTQDYFFKRLAFYTEKQGFTGRLASDKDMQGLHGYNAHDYRAESLASFYELARAESFQLNKYELLLRDILLTQGIIKMQGDAYVPGSGAVISISQESPDYLRYNFMAHEGFHGLYFIDEDFRKEVAAVYERMPELSKEFIASYFTAMDSLGYNTDDLYLMQNELMAYLLQQPVNSVEKYFASTLADRLARRGLFPQLVSYVKGNGVRDFVSAASALEEYVYERWGYAAGRVSLLSYSRR